MLSAGIDLMYLPKIKRLLKDGGFVAKILPKWKIQPSFRLAKIKIEKTLYLQYALYPEAAEAIEKAVKKSELFLECP